MGAQPTGSEVLDELLGGGYEKGIITTVYGPAGAGKSNIMLLAIASLEGRAIFVDPEGSFSVDRIKQLNPDVTDLLDRVVLLKPTNWQQQAETIAKLPEMMRDDIELIIVDSIAAQYRAARADSEKDVNQSLAQQINALYTIAAEHNIPVLLTSQVYADLEKDGVRVVGGDIVKYSSKCLLELTKDEEKRSVTIKKHRFLPAGKQKSFVIENVGIYEDES